MYVNIFLFFLILGGRVFLFCNWWCWFLPFESFSSQDEPFSQVNYICFIGTLQNFSLPKPPISNLSQSSILSSLTSFHKKQNSVKTRWELQSFVKISSLYFYLADVQQFERWDSLSVPFYLEQKNLPLYIIYSFLTLTKFSGLVPLQVMHIVV